MNIDPRFPRPFPPPFATAWGDDSYGLWAELALPAAQGEVVQRLRWIEPGTFWMGSSEGEAEWQEREGPRHEVTLSAGFWLADTACTQALWEAVMLSNPSRFRGKPQRPVEQVSWDDVQEFLHRLERVLPGVKAELPTEAEWEYACRAGTETPFSFGEQIDAEQANFDGNNRYKGGEQDWYGEGTVEVKTFAPNGWGLYEMHGNVWEWCGDGMREYNSEAQRDPRGSEGFEGERAVRGGSWIYIVWWLRSAFRLRIEPGDRYDDLGFRLALKSIESG